jgi:hypothetical protein
VKREIIKKVLLAGRLEAYQNMIFGKFLASVKKNTQKRVCCKDQPKGGKNY